VIHTAFSGEIPEKFKKEYLIQFNYFSSNSCQFLKDTNLQKTADCPVGNFICIKNDSIIDITPNLNFFEAQEFCFNHSAQLSEFSI